MVTALVIMLFIGAIILFTYAMCSLTSKISREEEERELEYLMNAASKDNNTV